MIKSALSSDLSIHVSLSLQQAFPNLQFSPETGALRIDWKDPDSYRTVFEHLSDLQLEAIMHGHDLDKVSRSIFADIVALKQHLPNCVSMLHLLQFASAYAVMSFAMSRQHLTLLWAWTIRSLHDVEFESRVDDFPPFTRLMDLAEEKQPCFVLQWDHMFSRWAIPFYFAAQRLGHPFHELAHVLFEKVIGMGMSQIRSPDLEKANYGADLLTVAFGWDAESPGPIRGGEQLAALYHNYQEGSFQDEVEFRLGMLFSSFVGRKHGLRVWMEAIAVLDKFPERPRGSQPLQLLIAIANGDIRHGSTYVHAIKVAVSQYRAHLVANTLPGINIGAYDSGRSFVELGFYVRHLLDTLQYGIALSLIRAWKGVLHDDDITNNALICLPEHPRGVAYVVPTNGWSANLEFQESLGRFRSLLDANNRALGDTHQLLHDEDFDLHWPDRLGVLDYQQGRNFESALTLFYLPEGAAEFLKTESTKVSGIALIPYLYNPIQTLLMKELSVSLPYVSSWTSPLPDRSISRVLIYQGDPHTAKFESDEVVRIFSEAGIISQVISASPEGWSLFKDLYATDEFDLLWIIGHGEFDHINPHEVHLGVHSSGSELPAELASLSGPMTGRRLLVLNVCSGGIGAALGGLPEFSIGHTLTTSGQAVISHLWPVLQFYPVYFGILLASALAKKSSHFQAYSEAMSSFVNTGTTGMTDLRSAGVAEELIERFDRASMDWTNILHWGSPVFLQ